MTREQQITHWAPIVSTVFRAENNIKAEWLPRLQEAKNLDEPLKEALADEYVRAVAAEIIDHCGMAFEGDDNESNGLIDPYDGD
jgi:hypothetical protein